MFDTRAMDTSRGAEISVRTYSFGETVVFLEDTTTLPGHTITLTAAEAHKLGIWLLEKAAEAELRNLEADVDA